jgi:hypothetical protein
MLYFSNRTPNRHDLHACSSGCQPWWRAFILCASALLAACGGGGSSSTAPATAPVAVAVPVVLNSVAGLVLSDSGAPLAGATVTVGGQSTNTGLDGRFLVNLAAPSNNTVVVVKKPGYVTTAKEVPVLAGIKTELPVTLFADQVTSVFSSASGSSVAPNGAAVQIPANAIQTASGAPFNGNVTIAASYFSPDTVSGLQAFAEPYAGMDAGARVPFRNVGTVEVKLSDAAGNPLQLKTGSVATITLPASSVSDKASTVPLWHYDEAAKLWVREGQVTRQPNGSFQGTVSHFTLWSANFAPANPAAVKGCFRDLGGNPYPFAQGYLRGSGWSTHMVSNSADANFEALVPPDALVELVITFPIFETTAMPRFFPGEVRQLNCKAFQIPGSPTTVPVPMQTTSFAPSPASFAGNYAGTYSGVEVGTFKVNIDAQGAVSGQTVSTTFNGSVAIVSGQISGSGAVLLAASGKAGSADFSGSVAPDGLINGAWNYKGSLLGGRFTGGPVP